MVRRSQHVLLFAAAMAVALALEGVLAFKAPLVRSADARGFAAFMQLTFNGRLFSLASAIAHWTPILFVPGGAVLVGIALARSRRRLALAIPLAMAGAMGTTELLKTLVTQVRYMPAVDGPTIAAVSWPSGHATAAMITALCAVLVVPARWRPPVAVAGCAGVLAVSYSMLVVGAHFPSDILAGLLISAMWMSLTLYVLWRHEAAPSVRVAPRLRDFRTTLAAGALAALGLAALAVRAAAAPMDAAVGGSLLAAAAAVALVAALLTGGLVATLQSHRRLRAPTSS